MKASRWLLIHALEGNDPIELFKYVEENYPYNEEIKNRGFAIIHRIIKGQMDKKHLKNVAIFGCREKSKYIELYCVFRNFKDRSDTAIGKIEIEWDTVNFVFLNTGQIVQYRMKK